MPGRSPQGWLVARGGSVPLPTPTGCPPPQSHPGMAPAAASPSPSCRSPSWLGDPAWGQPSGWGGLRAELSPRQPPGTPPPRLARGASPLPRPGSRPAGAGLLRPSLRRGMLHFRRFISSDARRPPPPLRHRLSGGSQSSPPGAPAPHAEGQGESPGAPRGSALSPHISGPFAPRGTWVALSPFASFHQ